MAEVKQTIVINRALKMSTGKIAAQASLHPV
jgi:peptidyl-tRNA hydrolase